MIWKYILYVLIALATTVIGSISGMGGGVMMKPLYDLLNDFNATQIAVMTSTTVFTMSLVSVVSRAKSLKEENVDIKTLIFITIGAVVGGYVGQKIFAMATSNATDYVVKIIQNSVLLVAIAFIIIYMQNKEKVKSLNCRNIFAALAIGLGLGVISSFLGIGGGPMNVAIIVFVFGYSMKGAAICSMFIIIFSQATKITSMMITNGIQSFAMWIVPLVIVAGVVGALLGKAITKKLTDKGVQKFFVGAQILIVVICIVNIVRYAIAL